MGFASAASLPLLRRAPLINPAPLPLTVNAQLLPPALSADYFNIFAVLATAGAAGHALGKTKVGRMLSGPVCAMAITFALTSTNVLPPASHMVSTAQLFAVQLGTPLLLFSADLRAVGRRAGRLLPAFALGTIGTTLGALVGLHLCSAPLIAAFGVDGIKAATALAAKNIGGGLNFVGVAAALRLSPGAFAAALAVDNVMALLYFPLCTWIGRQESDPCDERDESCEVSIIPPTNGGGESVVTSSSSSSGEDVMPRSVDDDEQDAVGVQTAALSVALLVAASSRAIAARVAPGFDLPIATAITVAAATAAPRALAPLTRIGNELGTTCLFLFFATAGWTGGALGSALLTGGPPLLAFLTTLYAVHLAVVLGVGALLRRAAPNSEVVKRCLALPQLLIASNANIGGPATASALAVGSGWSSLVAPALLVGNLGYAIATPMGLLLHALRAA